MVRPRSLSWLLISAVSLAIAAPPAVLGAEGDPTPVRFHYDWVPTAGDMPILAAEDLGLFDEAGLDVTTTPGGPEVNCLQLVAAGQQDICIAPTVGVLTAHPGGVPIVAVGMISKRARTASSSRPIARTTAPADLKGHPVGVHPFDPQYAMWKAFEAANGIGDGDVSEVTVSFGPEPLYEGQVDAIPNFLSLLPALVGQQYGQEPVTFLFADHGAWAGGQTIVANRDWATTNPEAVTAFLDAYRKAMAWGLAGIPRPRSTSWCHAIQTSTARSWRSSCPRSWASGSPRTRTPTACSPCPMRCGSARTRCSATTATWTRTSTRRRSTPTSTCRSNAPARGDGMEARRQSRPA